MDASLEPRGCSRMVGHRYCAVEQHYTVLYVSIRAHSLEHDLPLPSIMHLPSRGASASLRHASA